jgi:tetratricopeptide (TPR) repeat protein
MNRLIPVLSVLFALGVATPSYAAKSKSKTSQKKKRSTTKQVPDPKPEETEAPMPSGGLDLSSPEKPAAAAAPEKGKSEKPAAAMQFDAVDLSGKSGDRQRLDAAVQEFKNEDYERSVVTANEILKDPKLGGLHLEAQYLMAKALYRMKMYHSSLQQFSKLLAKGPGSKFFKTSLEWLFFISHKTTNESVVLEEIAKYSNHDFPEKFRNEFRYLLARYHFVRGRALDQVDQKAEADKSFAEVRKLTSGIPRNDPFYPRAKYLEGLTLYRDKNFQGALESLKEVVRLTRESSATSGMPSSARQDLRELAFMQLARVHYEHRQNRYAIYYYGKVERGSAQWLEALFEASWANYRIGQYEQALGNLITLSSPFFREEYFPEALILKAVIYYENCRYREALMILEDFDRIYMPVHDQLETIMKNERDASEYYNVLADIQKKERDGLSSTDLILERILRLALTDKDLKKTNDSILELEEEVGAFSSKSETFRYADIAKELLDGLKGQREALVRKAGVMAKGKLEFELEELKKLLANGERIKFETTTKEKEFLEQQLQVGGKTDVVKKYKYSVAVADDQLYWPYVGEYWRDELGTYQYTLTKGCVDRDTANQRKREAGTAGGGSR